MGHGSTDDIAKAHQLLTNLKDKFPKFRPIRSRLAMCSIANGNRNPSKKAKFFAIARAEFEAYIKLAPPGDTYVPTARMFLKELEKAGS